MTNFQLFSRHSDTKFQRRLWDFWVKSREKTDHSPLDIVSICSLCKFHFCNSVTEKALGIWRRCKIKVLFLKTGRTKKTAKKMEKSHEAKKFALQFHICCANFRKIDPETKKANLSADSFIENGWMLFHRKRFFFRFLS